MNRNQKIFTAVIVLLLLLLCCIITAGGAGWWLYNRAPEAAPETEAECAPCEEEAVVEDLCAGRMTPVLAEGEFPGTVEGPAIVEWWDGGPNTSEHEGIFSLSAGETFTYENRGHWWTFCSQEALDERYPTHMAEFLAKWPMDEEGRPPGK